MGDELEKVIAEAIASGITDDATLEAIAQQWEAQQTPMPAGATAGMLPQDTAQDTAPLTARQVFEMNRGPDGSARSAELRQEAVEHPIRTTAMIAAPGVLGKMGKMAAPHVGPTLTKVGGALEAPAAGAAVGALEGSRRGVRGAISGALYGAAGGAALGPVLSRLGTKLTPVAESVPPPVSPIPRLTPKPMERFDPGPQDPNAVWPATAARMGQGAAPPQGLNVPGVMDVRKLSKVAGRETEAADAAAGARLGQMQGTPSTLQADRARLMERLTPPPMERPTGPLGPIVSPARMLPEPAIQLPPGPTPDPSFVRSIPAVDVGLGGRTALPPASTRLGSALEPSFARGVPAQLATRIDGMTPAAAAARQAGTVPSAPAQTPAPAVTAKATAPKPAKPKPAKTEQPKPVATAAPTPAAPKKTEGVFADIAAGDEMIFRGTTTKAARGKQELSPNDLKVDEAFVKANPNATLEERLRHLTTEKAKREAAYRKEGQARKAEREKGGTSK